MPMLLAVHAAGPSAAIPYVLAPPPPIAASPVSAVPPIRAGDTQPAPRIDTVDVVVRAPSGVLWQGSLRVSERGESNWSQSKAEAPGAPCPARDPYWTAERETLGVSLAPVARYTSGGMTLQVRWSRHDPGTCDGLRIVELRQTVVLTGERAVVVGGDGGLRVELRRRASPN